MTESTELSGAESSEKLTFRDNAGRRRTLIVRHGAAATRYDSGVLTRSATSDDGLVVVKKWLPSEVVSHHPELCELLENEARAGVRLGARFPLRYPTEVTRLIGYDLDGIEPFVLLTPLRGRPVDEVGQLLVDEQRRFQVSLLTALLVLAEAEVVHCNIGPGFVRWDGTAVQIGDFTYAAAVGDTRTGHSGHSGLAEDRQLATTADDVWAAGLLILQVATGQADYADLDNRGPALRNLLEGVFTAPVGQRPSAAVLLKRLGVTPRLPGPDPRRAQAMAEGLEMFDRVLAEKWPAPPPPPFSPPEARPNRPSGFRLGRWSALALAVVSMLVALVLVAVLL
jgi:hypothetical protein